MGFDILGSAVVDPQGLEQTVAEEESGIVGRNSELFRRENPSIPPGEAQDDSPAPSAARKARALTSLSASSNSGSESATMPQPA